MSNNEDKKKQTNFNSHNYKPSGLHKIENTPPNSNSTSKGLKQGRLVPRNTEKTLLQSGVDTANRLTKNGLVGFLPALGREVVSRKKQLGEAAVEGFNNAHIAAEPILYGSENAAKREKYRNTAPKAVAAPVVVPEVTKPVDTVIDGNTAGNIAGLGIPSLSTGGTYQKPIAALSGTDEKTLGQSIGGSGLQSIGKYGDTNVYRREGTNQQGEKLTTFSDAANIDTNFGGNATAVPEGLKALNNNSFAGEIALDRVLENARGGRSQAELDMLKEDQIRKDNNRHKGLNPLVSNFEKQQRDKAFKDLGKRGKKTKFGTATTVGGPRDVAALTARYRDEDANRLALRELEQSGLNAQADRDATFERDNLKRNFERERDYIKANTPDKQKEFENNLKSKKFSESLINNRTKGMEPEEARAYADTVSTLFPDGIEESSQLEYLDRAFAGLRNLQSQGSTGSIDLLGDYDNPSSIYDLLNNGEAQFGENNMKIRAKSGTSLFGLMGGDPATFNASRSELGGDGNYEALNQLFGSLQEKRNKRKGL